MRHLFWFSIQSAKNRVYITNPYFVPDEIMKGVIKERAKAGVDVRVLVPNENIDLAAIRWASQSCWEELLDAGVRIYEYQPTMIHQKLLVADGVWSIVGSANMDVRSKELNQENSLGILDSGFAEEVERTFFADLEKAREVRLDEWRRRGSLTRARERFFCLFEEQF
jgi:cardiolipin synthase